MATLRPLRTFRRAGLALVLLLAVACFEAPVTESLRLRFLPEGPVIVTSSVELNPLAQEGERNPALDRRLADLRRDLLEGLDPWARRFDSIKPVAERFTWEKRLGQLTGARRSAVLDEPAALHDLFADTALSFSYEVREDGVAELTIVPGAPTQATRKQRRDLERALDEWSARIAEYLAATADLYRWLDDNPGRARACMLELFGDVLDEKSLPTEEEGEPEELSAEEQKRVDRVKEAMSEVFDVLLIPKGQDRSLDELSHLVYDSFPAPLTVQLPGEPLEVEGFEPSGDEKNRIWSVDTPGLWSALRSLEERWVAPDPVLVYVKHKRTNAEGLDLSALMDAPRRVVQPLPNSLEVKRAIEKGLKPAAAVYRAVWKTTPQSEDEEFSWEE
jgi:hypothetical protein